jgi:hypothetical protein
MALSPEANRLVRGSDPVVGIEAAAGAGKTHFACQFALEAAAEIRPYQSVLFLSHTNAARDVFRRRVFGADRARSQVTVSTLDSFCLNLLSPYAALWQMPVPLRPPHPVPADWFARARNKAARLLEAKPAIARAVVAHFPIILADEHQDASRAHHAMLLSLAARGATVRMLGDGLQAILTFDPTIPGWSQLMDGLPTVPMTGGARWIDAPELGSWIAMARAQLIAGQPIQLRDLPSCVHVVVVDRTPGQAWSRCPELLALLASHSADDDLIVLGRRNSEVNDLARQGDLNLVVNEGTDLAAAEQVLEEVLAASGDAGRVAASAVDFMLDAGVVDPTSQRAISDLDTGTSNLVLQVITRSLATHPDLFGLVTAIRAAKYGAASIGWAIRRPVAVHQIVSLPTDVTASTVREFAYQAQRAASESAPPRRCASTIHKAKGREFPHVVVPSLDRNTYRASLQDRQLLYVTLSRATREVTLVVPASSPSPLVEL